MTRQKDKHLQREEIFDAISRGTKKYAEHLSDCPDCNSLYETLLHFEGASSEAIEQPSARLLDRLSAIPQLVGRRSKPARVQGSLVFDSWRDVPVARLRSVTQTPERRLRFVYGSLSLEIVAEWQSGCWELTARVYDGEVVTCRYVLKIGRSRLAPETHDCYFLKRPKLPRIIELLSPDLNIRFSLPGVGSEVGR